MKCILQFLLSVFFLSFTVLSASADAEIVLINRLVQKGRVGFTYIHKGQSDVYSIAFATGEVKPLVVTPKDDEYPVWSPDGKKIAYYSDITGDREIYVADADGTNAKQLTTSPGIDEDPDWDPSGTRLVFRSERDDGRSNLYAMNIDGTGLERLTSDGAIKTVPRWSPTGASILHSTNAHWPGWDIAMYDLQTKKSTALTSGIRTFCHAAWRPDGKAFLYSHGGGKAINLWLQTLAGEETRLTEYDGRDYDAAWIDNDDVLFVREENKGKEDYQLYHLNIQRKEITRLTKNNGAIRDLSYSPHD